MLTYPSPVTLAVTLTQEGKPRVRTAGCGSRRGLAALGLERGRAAQRCTKSTILPLVGPRLTVNDWLPSVVSVTDA